MWRGLTLLCLMLVVVLGGCGSAAPTGSPRPSQLPPLAATPTPSPSVPLSAPDAAVVAAVAAASSVTVNRTDGGSTTGTATTQVSSTNTAATGSIKYVQIGGAQLTVVNNTLYIIPDAQLASNCNCAAGSFTAGQCYEVTPGSASQLGLQPSDFLSNSPTRTAAWLAAHPMTETGVSGSDASARITFVGADSLTMVVDAATHLPMTISQPNVLQAQYTGWGQPLTVAPPPHCIPE